MPHLRIVSGRTSSRRPCNLGRGSERTNAASTADQPGLHACLPSWRCNTAIWCRSTKISASLSPSLRGSSRSNANGSYTQVHDLTGLFSWRRWRPGASSGRAPRDYVGPAAEDRLLVAAACAPWPQASPTATAGPRIGAAGSTPTGAPRT